MAMGKLRKWFYQWFDKQLERSFQRKANKIFDKSDVKYNDGDNT